MSWFARLAPFRKGGAAVAEAVREEAVNGSAKDSPRLICLVNDASGRASFKTHVFADSESATDFVLYWFPNQSEGGITAFWALTFEPSLDGSSDTRAEPLVMVRDVRRDGVVYLFSFSDIESAQAFLRDEVQNGTDLGAMMLYWAVPVRMATDPWGKMMLTPAVPPGAARDVHPEAPAGDIWTPPPALLAPETHQQEPEEDSRTIFQEAPNAYTGVAEPASAADDTFELTAWMERARKKPSEDSEAPTLITARPPMVLAEAPLARAEARVEPRSVDEEAPSPTQPSGPEKAAVTPAPILEEAPAQTEGSHALAEPPHIVEETPPASHTSESTQEPTPAQNVNDAPFPIAESAAPSEDATEGIPAEPVILEGIADEATPVASSTDEAAQPPDEQAEAAEEARAEDGEAQVDLATIPVNANGNGHLSNPNRYDDGHTTKDPAEIVVHQNGHSAHKPAEVDSDAAPEPATEAEAGATQNGNGHADYGVDIRIDIRLDASRAMQVKRWEVREEPFEGFNSPPGRF